MDGNQKASPKMLGRILYGTDFPRRGYAIFKKKQRQKRKEGEKNGDAVPVIGSDFLRTCFRPVTLSVGCIYAQRGDLVMTQGACMGCPPAESTLQAVRLCREVTPYRSDLKEGCRSHRRI